MSETPEYETVGDWTCDYCSRPSTCVSSVACGYPCVCESCARAMVAAFDKERADEQQPSDRERMLEALVNLRDSAKDETFWTAVARCIDLANEMR